jgi:predicted Zn-dependent protease
MSHHPWAVEAGRADADGGDAAREGALTSSDHFETLADAICRTDLHELRGSGVERIALSLDAEESDFIRFNHARVRQATQVRQGRAVLSVVRGQRRIEGAVSLTGDPTLDIARLRHEASALVAELPQVQDDPHLLLAPPASQTRCEAQGRLPSADEAVRSVTEAAGLGRAAGGGADEADFVGIHAAGPVARAYADSTGSRHWHRSETFHLDWCLYASGNDPALRDKAVKSSLAGRHWAPEVFAQRVEAGLRQLPLLREPPRALPPGRYRAAFSPAAMAELLETLAWSGFSARDRRHGTSSLVLLSGEGDPGPGQQTMHPGVTLSEATADSGAPLFTADGFVKPPRVALIDRGRSAGVLTSARTAQEYGLVANGADEYEAPDALRLEPGTLPSADLLAALDTGLYVSNLWYLNYSDRSACRITGMTRFACFWVENGRLVAPLAVMRFDDSMIRMLGSGLVALTDHAEAIPDAGTYGGRRLGSVTTPAAIIDGFTLTL